MSNFWQSAAKFGVGSVCSAHKMSRWWPKICCELQQCHQRRGQVALVHPSTSPGPTFDQQEVWAAPSWEHLWGCWHYSCGSWGGWWSGLTHVSCPYSADKLPQLCGYLKQSPCCPQSPAGFRTDADGSEGSQGERKLWHINSIISATNALHDGVTQGFSRSLK